MESSIDDYSKGIDFCDIITVSRCPKTEDLCLKHMQQSAPYQSVFFITNSIPWLIHSRPLHVAQDLHITRLSKISTSKWSSIPSNRINGIYNPQGFSGDIFTRQPKGSDFSPYWICRISLYKRSVRVPVLPLLMTCSFP